MDKNNETKNADTKNSRKRSISERATTWVGSTGSLVVHTILFAGAFAFVFFGASLDTVLLVLTTIVSLEAIYLAIFIQMTVNRQALSLENVEDDIDEMQEDIDEMQEDIEEIGEDIDEISEDVDEIAKDVDELSEDVDEIAKDIDEIGEDIDDIQEHDEKHEKPSLDKIEEMLKHAIEDLERLKKINGND